MWFWSVVQGRQARSTVTGREAAEFFSLGAVHLWMCSVVFPFACFVDSQCTVGIALCLTLSVGMPAIGPGASQVLFTPRHRHGSIIVRSYQCRSCPSGPPVGAMAAAWTLVWLGLHVSEPTAAKARPIPRARALAILSDDAQELNLGSHQQRCNYAVFAPMRRNFSSSSLVTKPPGAQQRFIPFSGWIFEWGWEGTICTLLGLWVRSRHQLVYFLIGKAIHVLPE